MNFSRLMILGLLGFSLAAGNNLAPLSAPELQAAVTLLKTGGHLKEQCALVSITLIEPAKDSSAPIPREARAVVIDHAAHLSKEVDLDLTSAGVRQVRNISNGQPLETFTEFTEAQDSVRRDPAWQQAIRMRGITNYNEVYVAVWAGGHHPPPGPKTHRYGRAVSYHARQQTNTQGPPIEGIEAIVDLDRQQVVHVIDTGVRSVPGESTDFYDPKVRGTNRAPLKPLQILQPEGPSFTLNDFEVAWDQWRFAWSFNSREGLVLHRIRYVDGGRERMILHRASLSEMLVPYGSPEKTWFWRNAVDQGEYGLGNSSTALVPGQTAPPHATLLHVPTCSEDGTVSMATNRVALYERIGESLWSHTSADGITIGRRSRELAMTFIATVGNYDYRYTWTFQQDGVIEFEVAMTGILLMAGSPIDRCRSCDLPNPAPGRVKLTGDERFGTLVGRNTIAVNHQHFVNLRLDFDVDGVANSIKEINASKVRGRRANPFDNAWEAAQTVFGRERDARRDLNPSTHRHWAVFNSGSRTALGHFPSYLLEPGGNAVPLLGAKTRPRQLLGFINHAIHATRLHPRQQFAGGEYPNQIQFADNIETWANDNESIHQQDLVVWYTLGMTHIPRPEEFPIMPSARTGFRLVPKGFFDRNPALDVPE